MNSKLKIVSGITPLLIQTEAKEIIIKYWPIKKGLISNKNCRIKVTSNQRRRII